MKLPSGWVFIAKNQGRATIAVEEKELILCENCKYHREGFCTNPHWDLSKITYPATEGHDYCSFAEKDEDN